MKDDLFDEAFEYMIKFEGDFVSNSNDPGGDTKFGISRKFYPALDIKNLTISDAKCIYKKDFWLKAKCYCIVHKKIAIKFFDIAVNTGVCNAVKILQRAVMSSGIIIKEDGRIGMRTLDAVNSCKEDVLLAALKSEVAGYYRLIIAKNKLLSTFENGWLKRAYYKI